MYSLSSLITSISTLDMLRHAIEGEKWTWTQAKFWRDKWRFAWSSRALHMRLLGGGKVRDMCRFRPFLDMFDSVTSVRRAHQRLAQSAVKTTYIVQHRIRRPEALKFWFSWGRLRSGA